MNFNDVIKNPHFVALAAILRVPFSSLHWRRKHPQVPFWTLNENLSKAIHVDTPLNRDQVVKAISEILVSVTEADPTLCYTPEDLDWLFSWLDQDDTVAKAVFSLLMAYYSAEAEFLTPAEAAERTGTAESTWRNKAAAGKIPGAIKKGKQWLLPVSVLRSQGVEV